MENSYSANGRLLLNNLCKFVKFKLPAFLAISSFLFVGCSSTDSRLSLVKNGVMDFCPQATVKEMVNNYVANPKWSAFEGTDGGDYVNINGKITYMEKPVDMVLQFKVDTDSETFEVNAFEINDIPQNLLFQAALLDNMCSDLN